MRILISGGAGFVGSHVTDRLLARGDSVVVADDLSSGSTDNLDLDHPALTFVNCDVSKGLPDEVMGATFDQVWHLASPASPPEYLERPLQTLDVGSLGTRHLLDIARRDTARFLLTSTSEVYGDPLVHPQPESYWGNVNPIGPRSVYDEAKRFAEALTMSYHREFGLDVRIARLFNTYGPRLRPQDGRVVSNFVAQALAGQPLTVFGDGTQTRSFGFVDDIVSGLVLLADSSVDGPVNLGNPNEFTMLQLAEAVQAVVGSHCELEFRDLPVDDPALRRPDISRARELLGWEPTVALKDGLAVYVAWVKGRATTN